MGFFGGDALATGLTVRNCTSESDFDAARQMCREFVDWLYAAQPQLHHVFDVYFEPLAWESTLRDLPRIHARPRGDIFVAWKDGAPVGCIMYHRLRGDTGEVKRLFVSEAARGTGAGIALVDAMIAGAKADSYSALQLDTGNFMTAAQGLYAKRGFRRIPTPEGTPAALTGTLVFMHLDF